MARVVYEYYEIKVFCDDCHSYLIKQQEPFNTVYPFNILNPDEQWDLTADPSKANRCDECGCPVYHANNPSQQEFSFERKILEADRKIALISFKEGLGGEIIRSLLKELYNLLNHEVNTIFINLEDVTTIYSNGMGILNASSKEIAQTGGKLILISSNSKIRSYFNMGEFSKDLTVVQDLDEAFYLCKLLWSAQKNASESQ